MNKLFNVVPLIVIAVLITLGISNQRTGNREQGTGNRERSTVNSMICEVVPGSIYDGDTLKVSCNGAIAKIRLACLDAPERSQQGGIESRDFLRNLINKNGSSVAMIPLEQDRYGRTVSELVLKPGSVPEVSIQEQLLINGQARIYDAYSDCPNISAFRLAQEIAQKKGVGVWGYDSIPPWEFRKQKR